MFTTVDTETVEMFTTVDSETVEMFTTVDTETVEMFTTVDTETVEVVRSGLHYTFRDIVMWNVHNAEMQNMGVSRGATRFFTTTTYVRKC